MVGVKFLRISPSFCGVRRVRRVGGKFPKTLRRQKELPLLCGMCGV